MVSFISESPVLSVVVPFLICLALSSLLAIAGIKEEQVRANKEARKAADKNTNAPNEDGNSIYSYLEVYRKRMKMKRGERNV